MIGKTDICRDLNRAELILRAIADRKCKFFKIKTLHIIGFNHRQLSPLVPLLKEKKLIVPIFNKHGYTYERLFSPSDIENVIQGLGG